jgi:hypothetical protein
MMLKYVQVQCSNSMGGLGRKICKQKHMPALLVFFFFKRIYFSLVDCWNKTLIFEDFKSRGCNWSALSHLDVDRICWDALCRKWKLLLRWWVRSLSRGQKPALFIKRALDTKFTSQYVLQWPSQSAPPPRSNQELWGERVARLMHRFGCLRPACLRAVS